MKKLLLIIAVMLMLSSCAIVQEFEKVFINDPDMALEQKKIDRFKSNIHSYREAASGGNGGKTGGGCGCN
jgi:hypothetical protein